MINHQKLAVILPAYNAARTLKRTCSEISHSLVDELILVDDASQDDTLVIARELGIPHIVSHHFNGGYGKNQKSCFRKALELQADIIVMLHPDYQYTPKLIPVMAHLVASGLYPVVLGSRIAGNGALKGGMPLYKYVCNRLLTAFQNICTGARLSEYHTGYRAYSASVLRSIDIDALSDDFLFDNQILSAILLKGHPIGEISCPTRYAPESSSIGFKASLGYGLGVLSVSARHLTIRLQKLARHRLDKFRTAEVSD